MLFYYNRDSHTTIDSTVYTMLKGFKLLLLATAISSAALCAQTQPSVGVITLTETDTEDILLPVGNIETVSAELDTTHIYDFMAANRPKHRNPSIYALPYSFKTYSPDWKRLWVNTAIYATAFCGTLFTLECLPEDATTWNRAAIQSVPPFKRWYRNIFVRNPEIDHDKWIFNYVLHPYAGAVYFMAARSAGFNFWRSFLYCSIVSNIGWEFGVEAFMERPSYQDLVITPCVGSLIGEGFYKLKRHIVYNNYRLWGSPVLGNIVAFIVDPVNALTDLFLGSNTRNLYNPDAPKTRVTSSLMPALVSGAPGFTFSCTF